MTLVSVFTLGALCGFAVPHVYNWLDWWIHKQRRYYE